MSYLDIGFNNLLTRPNSIQDKGFQELDPLELAQLLDKYELPFQQITEGKIVSPNGNLVIDLDNENISLKKEDKEFILGDENWFKLTDQSGNSIINQDGLILSGNNFKQGIQIGPSEMFTLADLDNIWQKVPGFDISFSLDQDQYVYISTLIIGDKVVNESNFWVRIMDNDVPIFTDIKGVSTNGDNRGLMIMDQDLHGLAGSNISRYTFSASFVLLFKEGTRNLRVEAMKSPATDQCRIIGGSSTNSASFVNYLVLGR